MEDGIAKSQGQKQILEGSEGWGGVWFLVVVRDMRGSKSQETLVIQLRMGKELQIPVVLRLPPPLPRKT